MPFSRMLLLLHHLLYCGYDFNRISNQTPLKTYYKIPNTWSKYEWTPITIRWHRYGLHLLSHFLNRCYPLLCYRNKDVISERKVFLHSNIKSQQGFKRKVTFLARFINETLSNHTLRVKVFIVISLENLYVRRTLFFHSWHAFVEEPSAHKQQN